MEDRVASPQKENGFTPIANEIVEQLAKTNLNAYEWRTLWALWRKTYGWHKTSDYISISQFQRITTLKRRHQCRALKALKERNIVTYIGDSRVRKYRFQKDYLKWKDVTYKGAITSDGTQVSPNQVTKVSPIWVHTKEYKETIQKKETFINKPSLKTLRTLWFTVRKKEPFINLLREKGIDVAAAKKVLDEAKLTIL
jgi:phage replication O-like protein O